MTATLPELDEQTIEELQPPCDYEPYPCSSAAVWVIRFSCACAYILCDQHKTVAVDYYAFGDCNCEIHDIHDIHISAVEPLR